MAQLEMAETTALTISYFDHGTPTGWPVVLSHGFPYSPHAFSTVIPSLLAAGARVIVPYLRGFGPTRFVSPSTPRTGQQAALGSDLIALLDALDIEKALVAGFDWGGVASCVAAALWPERVSGLVSYAGYDIVDVARSGEPCAPSLESVMWYQHLFQTERGRKCLARDRKGFCKLLWKQWSPGWDFSEKTFEESATAFENPDFVDVVIHAYRFCFGNEPGDPALEELESKLTTKPKIRVPCITLDGSRDPLKPGGTAAHAEMFIKQYKRREADVGHAFPYEAPDKFAEAILDVHRWSEQR
ncbi:Alpha/Beta hydrolase protein [Xylariaceae sp. FL0016]|nr:Alpha/Beta hydrolase protein [Xylariaceae sp. FL0016]